MIPSNTEEVSTDQSLREEAPTAQMQGNHKEDQRDKGEVKERDDRNGEFEELEFEADILSL